MRIALAIVLLASSGVLAQQPQRASDAHISGGVAEIVAQRNGALDRAAQLAGQLAEALAETERLKNLCGEKCKEKSSEERPARPSRGAP